jgi:hypothetical protein
VRACVQGVLDRVERKPEACAADGGAASLGRNVDKENAAQVADRKKAEASRTALVDALTRKGARRWRRLR